jgi:hypothetical protein
VSRGRLNGNTGNEESHTTYFEYIDASAEQFVPENRQNLKLVLIFEALLTIGYWDRGLDGCDALQDGWRVIGR